MKKDYLEPSESINKKPNLNYWVQLRQLFKEYLLENKGKPVNIILNKFAVEHGLRFSTVKSWHKMYMVSGILNLEPQKSDTKILTCETCGAEYSSAIGFCPQCKTEQDRKEILSAQVEHLEEVDRGVLLSLEQQRDNVLDEIRKLNKFINMTENPEKKAEYQNKLDELTSELQLIKSQMSMTL